MTTALEGIWADLAAMLALIDRDDLLAREAKDRICDGESPAAAFDWLREQEALACTA